LTQGAKCFNFSNVGGRCPPFYFRHGGGAIDGLLEKIELELLPFVDRPARYMGGELETDSDLSQGSTLKLALVYPDLYEVGMSNLGLKVLRAAASGVSGVAIDRAFVPWPDAQSRMRERGIPLYGLASGCPLVEFDLVGITLQSELTYTNVLTVLDLAGIPLRASERGENDPLICGGGPNAVNPAVMAPFFDFFVLGDGEAALQEVLHLLIGMNGQGADRQQRLTSLAGIEGVYVPALHGSDDQGRIGVRRIDKLAAYPEPDGLPVSLIELAQDHHAVEIMRGCTGGCRFCQAGMYYRPVRSRSVRRIARAARKGVRSGGWDSVTLLSLSSADYPAIEELVDTLTPEFEAAGVSLSFPSLRVDKRTLGLLGRISGGRRSGLTFAVEAGSERLRQAIGKKVDESDLLEMVETAFRAGWTLVKLYFMVGLPTETDEDLDEASRLIDKVAGIAKRVGGRRNVNVAVSPFVPKPGTPYQWEPQVPPSEMVRRIWRIRDGVRTRRVKIRYHDPCMSTLEGLLARGNSGMAAVVERAWREGARFDGWGEHFVWDRWLKALDECGLELEEQLAGRSMEQPLPWSFIDLPVDERFLCAQRESSFEGRNVSDCAQGDCLGCGVDQAENCKQLRSLPDDQDQLEPATQDDLPLAEGPLPTVENSAEIDIWRLRYTRRGLQRFVGHLDNSRNIEFMLRRSGLPVVHSAGFNARMRLHFSPALPLGVQSEAEYLDFELLPHDEIDVRQKLQDASAGMNGFDILELEKLAPGMTRKRMVPAIAASTWKVELPVDWPAGKGDGTDLIERRRVELLEQGGCLERTDKKGKPKQVDLRSTLEQIDVSRDSDRLTLSFDLSQQGPNSERPDRFIGWLLELDREALARVRIVKSAAVLPLTELSPVRQEIS
jgi:radical SAM family uncharacterized protein/radical SAM-linked protein